MIRHISVGMNAMIKRPITTSLEECSNYGKKIKKKLRSIRFGKLRQAKDSNCCTASQSKFSGKDVYDKKIKMHRGVIYYLGRT